VGEGLSFPLMVEQTEHDRHPASSPSRPGRPRAGGAGGSGSRRGVQSRSRRARRWSECRKSLQALGLGALRRLDRGRDCVQEEGEYEYAAYNKGSGEEEPRIEPAVLYQPLDEGASSLSAGGLQEGLAGGGVRRNVNHICHEFPGCGGNGSIQSRVIRSRPAGPPACAQQHDCPFPEPSNMVPARWVAKKVVQAGRVIVEWVLIE
jgi:hypothetical protein